MHCKYEVTFDVVRNPMLCIIEYILIEKANQNAVKCNSHLSLGRYCSIMIDVETFHFAVYYSSRAKFKSDHLQSTASQVESEFLKEFEIHFGASRFQ